MIRNKGRLGYWFGILCWTLFCHLVGQPSFDEGLFIGPGEKEKVIIFSASNSPCCNAAILWYFGILGRMARYTVYTAPVPYLHWKHLEVGAEVRVALTILCRSHLLFFPA